jgi:hypothetical protein
MINVSVIHECVPCRLLHLTWFTECVSSTLPATLLIAKHHTATVTDEWMSTDHRWNDTDSWIRSNCERKNCPFFLLKYSHELTWDRNGAHCDIRPAVYRLSHGTVHKLEWIYSFCLLMQSNSHRQGSPCVCHSGIISGERRYSSIVSWPRQETKDSGWPASIR